MNTENFTPEDEHEYLSWQKSQQRGKIIAGILIVAFGVIYLIHETGVQMPHWIFTPGTLLMAIGLVVLVKHKFKKLAGWILILIGKLLLIHEFYPNLYDKHIIWPIVIIIFGISMIFRSNKKNCRPKKWKKIKQHVHYSHLTNELDAVSENDFIDTVSFFGGVKKNIVTKNFKGADIVTVFGGTEINLSQADFENQAIIDLTCVFAGVSLVIPSNWQLKSEIVTAFGGIEDQRHINNATNEDNPKTLILRGNCVFGGIEIKSFN